MNYTTLRLEKIEIPVSAERVAKELGECIISIEDNLCLYVWDTTDNSNYFMDYINLVSNNPDGHKYVIWINASRGKPATIAKALKKETKNDDHPSIVLLEYFYKKLKSMSNERDNDLWSVIADDCGYYWVCDREAFKLLCADFSAIMRDLTKGETEEMPVTIFESILKDSSAENLNKVLRKC